MSDEKDLSKLSEQQLKEYNARLAKVQAQLKAEAEKRSGQTAQTEWERKVKRLNSAQLDKLTHGYTLDEVTNG